MPKYKIVAQEISTLEAEIEAPDWLTALMLGKMNNNIDWKEYNHEVEVINAIKIEENND